MPIINTSALADARPNKKRKEAPRPPNTDRLQVPNDRPIVSRSPAIPDPPTPSDSRVATTLERRDFDTVAVDNREIPIRALTPYIEGYEAWGVTYYGQVLGRDDTPKPFSIDMNPVNQQYTKISGMEIKVTNPLTYTYVNDKQSEQFRGQGLIQGNTIVPQRHDVFTAAVGRGMSMLFSIESVTPMSVMQETVYEIEYSSSDPLSESNEPYLEAKVVSDLHYSRELLLQGRRALIDDSQAHNLKSLKEHGNKLIRMMIEDFVVGNRHRYLALPDQDRLVVDVYLQETWYDLIDVTDYPDLRSLNWMHLDQIPEAQVPTLWDALLRKSDIKTQGVKYRMTKEMYVVEASDYMLAHSNPTLGGVYYSGIDSIVLPKIKNIRRRTMPELCPSVPRIDRLDETLNPGTRLDPRDLSDRLNGEAREIYQVQYDNSYVLSRHFYEEDIANQSALEIMISDYLMDKPIDARVLTRLCEQSYNWGSLERFYYTPILIILIEHRLGTN